MTMFVGLDVGGKRTAMCVVDEASNIVWRGVVDTHPQVLALALKRFEGKLAKVGLESGPFTPHLFRSLSAMGYPMVCIDAPFGIRLPSRVGAKRFAEAAYKRHATIRSSMSASTRCLRSWRRSMHKWPSSMKKLKEVARCSEVAWRLMSVPGVGPVTALAFIAALENGERFRRTRDIGAYLGLTERRYQSADNDVKMGISKQGDAMARRYLYEAANVLLTTVKKRFALRPWGLKLMRRLGPKHARVAVARKLAVLLDRLWKDGSHFAAVAAA
jgi:transposase